MSSHDASLEEIKSRLDIVDVISEFIPLKKAGQNWKGLCPFHAEKTPSFTVSPSKQIFYCFGCSTGGDMFSFLMKYEKVTFPESLDILARKAGVEMKKTSKKSSASSEKEALRRIHDDARTFYRTCLRESRQALEYLKKRGIGDTAVDRFVIGYAPERWDALLAYLKKRKYDIRTIAKAGLAVSGKKGFYDTFRNRIMFPIVDLRGSVIAFGGRVMNGSGGPKYLNSPETALFSKSKVLFGLYHSREAIREKGFALILEGYLDVIMAHMHGFDNAVAPLGTAITREQGQLIRRFTQDAVIIFDGDPSGVKAAKNGISVLLECGIHVKALSLPSGEDPDSYLRRHGKERLSRELENPMTVVDFFCAHSGRNADGTRDAHRVSQEFLEAVSRMTDSSLLGYYVRILSERLNINEVFIREQLQKIRAQLRKRGNDVRGSALSVPPRERLSPDEVYIVQILLRHPEKSPQIFAAVSEDDFTSAVTRTVFEKIRTQIETAGDQNMYNILIAESGEREQALIAEIMFRHEMEDPDKVLEDCLKRFRDNKRQTLLHDLQKRIKKAERENNTALLRTLLREQQEQLRLKG